MEPIPRHERHLRQHEPPHREPSPARLSARSATTRAWSGEEPARRGTSLFAVVVVALAVLAAGACGSAGLGNSSAADAKTGQGKGAQEGVTTAKMRSEGGRDETGARAGEAEARGGDGARAGKARAGADGAKVPGSRGDGGGGTGAEEGPREVTLEITGTRGTEFSGACSFGTTRRPLDGRAPERYVFEPRGKSLECELRTGGALGIVFTDGAGVRSEQQTAGGRSTVKLTYSNGAVSSSTSSSSVSESQTVTSSDRSTSEGAQ